MVYDCTQPAPVYWIPVGSPKEVRIFPEQALLSVRSLPALS